MNLNNKTFDKRGSIRIGNNYFITENFPDIRIEHLQHLSQQNEDCSYKPSQQIKYVIFHYYYKI